MKTALLTGITGQDGVLLAELLLSKGYAVHGVVRRTSAAPAPTDRIAHLLDRVTLHDGDLTDQTSLTQAVAESRPDEVYNLGAQTYVGISWKQPFLTAESTGIGAVRVLEAVRQATGRPDGGKVRIYQASSSEQFGSARGPQNEQTIMLPRSPYGCAKLYAHSMAVNYRESFGMHISCGILFNHESPLRPPAFVTRKVTFGAALIRAGRAKHIRLGNLDAHRDWGHARDYVWGMWQMLQQEIPDDYVLATGETHSVREWCEAVLEIAGLPLSVIQIDPDCLRPAEVDWLQGDARKARRILGWSPQVSFWELAREMTEADLLAVGVTPAAR